jgi:two-component system LytT family response regulator
MKYVIIEDEFLIRASIQKLMSTHFPEMELASEFDILQPVPDWLAQNKVDLIFMDINLPDGSGMDFIKAQALENVGIIFITAYPNYAVDAFRVSAIDYILKPIPESDFLQAVHKFFMYHELKEAKSAENNIVNYPIPDADRRLIIPSASGYLVYPFDQVMRLEGEGNYTRIHLLSGLSVLVSITLKLFHEALESFGFSRVHKSNLVNVSKIILYKRTMDGGILTLSDNSEVNVSRFYRQDFSARFLNQNVCIGF